MITLTFSNGKTIQAKNDVTAKEVLENFIRLNESGSSMDKEIIEKAKRMKEE